MTERAGMKKPGRPPTVNRNNALEQAMRHFWQEGYERTSMEDLVTCTGMHKGSIYREFGGKREFFLAALERYIQRQSFTDSQTQQTIKSTALSTLPPLKCIEFFLRFAAGVPSEELGAVPPEDPPGCLLTNTAVEFGNTDKDIAERIETGLSTLRVFLETLLTDAHTRGETPSESDPVTQARFILTLMQGLRVMARLRPATTEEINHTVALALQSLSTPYSQVLSHSFDD